MGIKGVHTHQPLSSVCWSGTIRAFTLINYSQHLSVMGITGVHTHQPLSSVCRSGALRAFTLINHSSSVCLLVRGIKGVINHSHQSRDNKGFTLINYSQHLSVISLLVRGIKGVHTHQPLSSVCWSGALRAFTLINHCHQSVGQGH